ncbi:Serine/threonine-protein phosphatase 2A activator 2 [Dimargaris xerosporica]|nr:Serine/threonine-protein phosphatase 2A activator 2 [Dimargaris xerosporica]
MSSTISASATSLPEPRILTKEDLLEFQHSSAYAQYMGLIEALNSSVIGKTLTDDCHCSAILERLLMLLKEIAAIGQRHPPVPTNGRFGNPALRAFYDTAQAELPELVRTSLGRSEDVHNVTDAQCQELVRYLGESFGNRERIDYGTGHEANFMAFVQCLVRLNLLSQPDYPAVVLRLFQRYLMLMRQLQFDYLLEPAGSHGVWGLDDYHFLPFLFGSAQLRGHKYIRPKSIHDAETVDEFAKDYMYLACIKFINSVKTASLRWHSPMLDDISGVKSWDKVNQGMVKMYRAEVLGKLPIMQHFMFGTLIDFEPTGMMSADADAAEPLAPGIPNASPIAAPEFAATAAPPLSYGGRPLVADDDGQVYTVINGKKIRLNIGADHCHGHSHTAQPSKDDAAGPKSSISDPLGHVHAKGQEFPTCCGMRIPSAIGAAQGNDSRARSQFSSGRIPFD